MVTRTLRFVEGDFRDIGTVISATKGMDAIVHLGGIVGDPACSIDCDLTIEINLRATRTIAEVGKGFGVKRFVFASHAAFTAPAKRHSMNGQLSTLSHSTHAPKSNPKRYC